VPSSDYQPELPEVAALVRTRTKDTGGRELGTFSDVTRPTDEEVNNLIAQALSTVESKVGSDIPEKMLPDAKHVVALQTAMLIELTLFPEQVATGRSPYKQYEDMYKDDLATLISDVSAIEAGGEEGVTGDDTMPLFNFSDGDDELIGWGTVW
jgi:hypothetical protein